jgi:hypothetical protein
MISSARLSAPSRRPLRRGTGRHYPPVGRARAGAGKVLRVPCTCRKQPEGPLSFTVPSCGAAQGRLPERPKGAVCKTVGYAFPGSNPGPATTTTTTEQPGRSACGGDVETLWGHRVIGPASRHRRRAALALRRPPRSRRSPRGRPPARRRPVVRPTCGGCGWRTRQRRARRGACTGGLWRWVRCTAAARPQGGLARLYADPP